MALIQIVNNISFFLAKILISKNVLCNYQIVGWDDSLGKNEKVIKEKIEKKNHKD